MSVVCNYVWVQLSIVRSCVLWRWNVSQLNLVIFHKTLHLEGTLQLLSPLFRLTPESPA